MSTLYAEKLLSHLKRIETGQQFPHAVLGPDLQARAISEPGDAYVLAPPLANGVFEDELGFPRLRDLVAACELADLAGERMVALHRSPPDLIISGTGNYTSRTTLAPARPHEVGSHLDPEDEEELRTRLDDGQVFSIRQTKLRELVAADERFGAGEATAVADDAGIRIRVGEKGGLHTITLPELDWSGEPFSVTVTGRALARAANTVPEDVGVQLILEGPGGHVGLRTEDNYIYAFPSRGS